MKNCKTCKFNIKRTLENKACLKKHMAIFGFGCYDYEPIREIGPNGVNKYEIGQQITIYDILEEQERND